MRRTEIETMLAGQMDDDRGYCVRCHATGPVWEDQDEENGSGQDYCRGCWGVIAERNPDKIGITSVWAWSTVLQALGFLRGVEFVNDGAIEAETDSQNSRVVLIRDADQEGETLTRHYDGEQLPPTQGFFDIRLDTAYPV